MENHDQFKEEFELCFKKMENLITESFNIMKDEPQKNDEIINLWRSHIQKFISFTFKTSEKYNNKDVLKAITKAIMFGK